MEAKAVTHFMHRSKDSEINNYQKRLVSPKRNHCDIREYHKFLWVVNSTDMLDTTDKTIQLCYKLQLFKVSSFLKCFLPLECNYCRLFGLPPVNLLHNNFINNEYNPYNDKKNQ